MSWRYTKRQQQLLLWLSGRGEPPEYKPGGLTAALRRLRKLGLIENRPANTALQVHELTQLGRDILTNRRPNSK